MTQIENIIRSWVEDIDRQFRLPDPCIAFDKYLKEGEMWELLPMQFSRSILGVNTNELYELVTKEFYRIESRRNAKYKTIGYTTIDGHTYNLIGIQ